MNVRRSWPAVLVLFTCAAWAQHDARQIAEDLLRHQALAEAMQAAATCFAQGKDRDACLAQIKASCNGLALGKYCGLKQDAMDDPARSFAVTAAAQSAAALCLKAGKAYETCIWDLQTACKGLAIGKYCGLVHAHSF